ncbi:MAG: hypothetical protein HY881_12895 [Deltaproteobacteria bacterium]|nr:hypothetical protein [Deltaproteobacteria bacterium]
MDPIWFYHVLHGGLGIATLLIALATLTAIWRFRGLLQWKRSLKHEFRELKDELYFAGPCRQQAIQVVLDRCQGIWQAGFPEINELSGLDGYLRDIAAAFHPDQEKPELCVTAGSLVRISHSAIERLQDILRRPGFSRFQNIRIRHIRKAWNWYERISRYRVVRVYIRYRRWINRANVLRLILLPDPFSWLIYLSNQLTILSLTRFFLMDFYLFAGKQAILAYDHETRHEAMPQDAGEIEQDLSDLADLIEPESRLQDPRIQGIRNRLVGVNTLIFSSPGYMEWRSGFEDALRVIAETYFPESPAPVEEARLGPILIRCQFWLQSISDTEKLPIFSRLHRIELRYLFSVKAVTEHPLFRQAGNFAKKSWNVYKWMQWPLLIYRLIKKTTPAGIAASMGWMLVRKGTVNYLSRRAFDLTLQEMETVYRLSQDSGDRRQTQEEKSRESEERSQKLLTPGS